MGKYSLARRYAPVLLDRQALKKIQTNAIKTPVGVELHLFADVDLRGVVDQSRMVGVTRVLNGYLVEGPKDGLGDSSREVRTSSLSIRISPGGAAVANVRTSANRLYEVRPAGGQDYVAIEIERARFPRTAEPLVPPDPDGKKKR